jgi:hypothetical protein
MVYRSIGYLASLHDFVLHYLSGEIENREIRDGFLSLDDISRD